MVEQCGQASHSRIPETMFPSHASKLVLKNPLSPHVTSWITQELYEAITVNAAVVSPGRVSSEVLCMARKMCADVVATLRAFLNFPIDAMLTWVVLVRRLGAINDMISATSLVAAACLAQKIACDDCMWTATLAKTIGMHESSLLQAESSLFGVLLCHGSTSFVSTGDVMEVFGVLELHVHRQTTPLSPRVALSSQTRSRSCEGLDAHSQDSSDYENRCCHLLNVMNQPKQLLLSRQSTQCVLGEDSPSRCRQPPEKKVASECETGQSTFPVAVHITTTRCIRARSTSPPPRLCQWWTPEALLGWLTSPTQDGRSVWRNRSNIRRRPTIVDVVVS